MKGRVSPHDLADGVQRCQVELIGPGQVGQAQHARVEQLPSPIFGKHDVVVDFRRPFEGDIGQTLLHLPQERMRVSSEPGAFRY